jgi:hypothetical protein
VNDFSQMRTAIFNVHLTSIPCLGSGRINLKTPFYIWISKYLCPQATLLASECTLHSRLSKRSRCSRPAPRHKFGNSKRPIGCHKSTVNSSIFIEIFVPNVHPPISQGPCCSSPVGFHRGNFSQCEWPYRRRSAH